MKRILYIFLVLATVQTVCAQRKPSSFEGEYYLAGTFPLGNFHAGKRRIAPEVGLEVRHNIRGSSFDVGLVLDMTITMYEFRRRTDAVEDYLQGNRTSFAALVSDYNFMPRGGINPFVGLGIGLGGNDILENTIYDENKGFVVVFTPRAGIELISRIRLTLTAHISKRGYNNASLSFGFVIGGGGKKIRV